MREVQAGEGREADAGIPEGGRFVVFRPNGRRKGRFLGWRVMPNGCHIWQGCLINTGYGMVRENGKAWLVHRLRYTMEVGPIPDGMVLDHFVCETPACCNPAHVRPVTQRENCLRTDSGLGAKSIAKTHCPKGHPLSGSNLRPTTPHRQCRTCYNEYRKHLARRKRAARRVIR